MRLSGARKWKWMTILLLGLGSSVALAQTLPPLTADDQMGTQPFNSYHGGDIDHIGLSNGTLNLDYPFLSYPQRGSLHLDFHLYYNNQPQHKAERCVQTPQGKSCSFVWGWTPAPPPSLPLERGDVYVGWAEQTTVYGTDTNVVINPKSSTPTQYDYARWSLQTADGAAHPLANLGTHSLVPICPGCTTEFAMQASGPWETLDATGWRVVGTLTPSQGDGSERGFPSAIVDPSGMINGTQDPNGNVIGTSVNGIGIATSFTDTLGRQIAAPPTASSASNTDTSTCPQPPQVPLGVHHAVLWSVPGPDGTATSYKFCYAVVAVNPPNPATVPPGSTMKLQSIVRPDSQSWNFQYNDTDGTTNSSGPINYGALTQITLPTGGTISYTYTTTGSGGLTCQNGGRFVASRTVNANDGTGNHTWTYAYSTTNTGNSSSPWSIATTVISPLLDQTVHTFNSLNASDNCPAYEGKTQFYQGSQSGGALLKTDNISYSFIIGDNSRAPLNVVPTQITTVWPNGKTATINKSYDSGFTYTGFKGSTGQNGIYGKELSESASDYGNNAAGPTLRTIKTAYLALSNSTYLTANLLDLVSSTAVQDGNGCTQAETDYTYDESQYLTAYTGTLPAGTHGAPPNSVRGNLTSVTHELFAANSCPTSTQSGPTTHTNWYDTGEVYQAIDALGNTATHSYDSAYAGTYSTKTCNALSQCVSGTYDFNTGLVTSFTDANGSYQASGNTPGDPAHTTTLQYNDPLWRLTQIQSPSDPSGNHPLTTINYPEANTVERLKTVTSSLTDDSFSYFDGLGRHTKSVHASAGNATVMNTYDADGRVASVTNPYFSSNDPTYGVTQTQYDALGRVTQVTKQDNSAVTTQYDQTSANSPNGDCTTTTDEAGKARKSCVDGLAHLIEVDEPQASSGSMSNPYVTLYSYDMLGNMLSVNQKGDGSQPARVRTFTYNSLSRLLTATNPESGQISYSYDANGNVLSKTSPAPNQTGTATQTISYCYDPLNRVSGKAYSAQNCPLSSPAVTYSYDSGTNGIGHLSSLTDQAGSGSYVYDALGRIAGEQRTIAGIQKSLSYTYNLDGSVATLKYPSGAVITYTPDAAGRTLSAVDVANNINYVTGAGGPNSGATYGPDGSLLSFNQGWTTSFAGIANSFSYNTRLQPVTMAAASPGTNGTQATASVTISGGLNNSSSGGGTPPLAATNSPLTSFVASDGSSHAFYLDTHQHIWHLFWNSTASWQNQDLTAITGNTPTAGNSSLSAVFDGSGNTHVFYLDSNQHVHELFCCSWQDHDLTALTGNTLAAAGSSLTAEVSSGNPAHVYYLGANQHVYHMFINAGTGSWQNQDLTAISGGPVAASGSSVTNVLDSSNGTHAFYMDANQHINQLLCAPGQCWQNQDLTAITGNTLAAVGTALTGYAVATGNPVHLFYLGPSQHLYHLFFNAGTGSWQNQDVSAVTGGPVPAAGTALTSLVDNSGVSGSGTFFRHYYLDGSQRVNETVCGPGECWVDTDLTAVLNLNSAAAGSGLGSYGMAEGNPVHVHYVGPNHHVYHLYLNGSGGWVNQDLSSLATVTLADSGTVSLTTGGFTATACFGASSNAACAGQDNATASAVASALAQALNASISPVTASASGPTINLTWKAPGPFTTPVSALSTTHDNPNLFSNPSFTSAATNFSGGTGANLPVFSLTYDFHAGNGDNGNVYGITNNRDNTRSQTFTYDALNRLTSAQNAGTDCTQETVNGATKYWGNSYGYDPWGNLINKTPTKCSAENLSVTALANNQLSGYGYDAAGNMIHDSTTSNNYNYDAENRITGAAGFTYTYDVDGNRVEKSNGSIGTIYWSMSPGIVAESDLSGNLKSEYVFFAGKRVARKDFPGGAVSYYFSDHLGTANVITNAAGTITEDEDHYPWGGELQFVNNDSNHYKFTGKERDAETGLDYFGARYYGNWLARWATPDPAKINLKHLLNPQKWNKYAYTINNPLRYFDPDGQEEIEVQLRAFIPQKTVSDPLGHTFAGDNRGFTSSQNVTSRTSITVRIETDSSIRPGNPIISVTQPGTAGQTQQLDKNGNVIKSATQTQGLPTVTGSRDANGNAVLNFQENAKNPLEPQSVTPGIRADLNVTVTQNGTSVDASGTISGTPSFELNVGSTNVPLQTAPSSTFGFGLGLLENNSVQVQTPLIPPPPPPKDKPTQ